MDGYAFIASIIQSLASLAWPAAMFGAVWLFREKLKELLPSLTVKHKEWEASFRLERAEKEAAELAKTSSKPAPKRTPEEKSRFEQLADVSPKAAILELRAEIEEAVRSFAEQAGSLPSRNMPILVLSRVLRAKGLINAHTSALLDDLRVIGNNAAHGDSDVGFTKDDAFRFQALADQLIEQLIE